MQNNLYSIMWCICFSDTYVSLQCITLWLWFVVCILQMKNDDEKMKWMTILFQLIKENSLLSNDMLVSIKKYFVLLSTMWVAVYVATWSSVYIAMNVCILATSLNKFYMQQKPVTSSMLHACETHVTCKSVKLLFVYINDALC